MPEAQEQPEASLMEVEANSAPTFKERVYRIDGKDVDEMTLTELEAAYEEALDELHFLAEEIRVAEINDATFSEETLEEFKNMWEYNDAPEYCVPIRTDVRKMDWELLSKTIKFDVIMTDPPWQLATGDPTRGVAISYDSLCDDDIEKIPFNKLSNDGYIFIWVINSRYQKAFDLMKSWGYKFVDDISWVKTTINRRMAKGHGFYLQHAKESCLVGVKGNPKGMQLNKLRDTIFSGRRGQSQKPEEIYRLIEQFWPNGNFLEIFARKNNLRDYWVSIGNEL
eukprot:GCRY01002921.1.p1 GENE.GCRY01002921.1~~GCRY01002921.1.p1  ORF type:complete len:281 (+),score=36.26 GCRY01002921.1:124-966(+)